MSIAKLKKSLKAKNTESFKEGFSGEDSTIVINNSFCYLEKFSDETLDFVKKILTYDNQEVILQIQQTKIQLGMAFRYRAHKRIQWLKASLAELEKQVTVCWLKGNKFPTGHLKLVKEELDAKNVGYDLKDARVQPKATYKFDWASKMNPPRYFQNEMLEIAKVEHRGVFESAVGSGKTYTSQLLVKEFGVPTLIVLPSIDLSIQTNDSYTEAFGESKVELIDSAKKYKTKKPIKICTVHTLQALLKKKQLDEFLANIGMICIDEVHHAGARSYTDLLHHFDHIYYRFGFSGTFMRNDSRTLDMWGFLSTVLYRYSAARATAEGFLTPLKILTHKIEGIKGSTYQSEYKRNYCGNPELLEKIKTIMEDYVGDGEQVLILVGRKEQSGHIIHEFLNELGISNQYVSGDSKKDNVRQALINFNNKTTQVLIGSSIIGEGIDVRSTDHLIMAQGGKSEIAVTQAVGRAVRLFPGKKMALLHDFRFEYTKYLEKHLNKRLDIYQKNFDGEVIC